MKINGKHVQFLTSGSTLAVSAMVAMTVACSGGGDVASGFESSSGGAVASDVYGSFGGACVRTGATTQPLVCSGSTYSGRALAAAANVGYLVEVSPIIDTGELSGPGGSLREELLEASILAPLVTTHVATSTTVGGGDVTTSTARIDRTTLRVAGIDVVAGVITTSAVARCTAGVVGYTPGFQIASLKVAGVSVLVDGSANQTVEVPGVLRVVINEQRTDGNGLTVGSTAARPTARRSGRLDASAVDVRARLRDDHIGREDREDVERRERQLQQRCQRLFERRERKLERHQR